MNTTVRGLAILLLAGVAGCGRQQTTAPAPPPPAVTVFTLKAERVTLTRELPGRTTPFLVAEVRPQVTGIVRERLFVEGGMVEAGQALYQLDDATYRAQFRSAEAALARARAALELARANARRSDELLQSNVISRAEHDTTLAALQEAEAEVGVAEAALAGAEVVLGYTRITSPISGRIGKSSVTAGALVTANQTAALAVVQQLDPIYVDLAQSSTELLQFRRSLAEGTVHVADEIPATILLEDGSTYAHQGKLAFAEMTVDPTTGSFIVRMSVPNPDQLLLPGMFVRAVVGGIIRDDAILVPQQGVTRDPKGNSTAMVIASDGTVEPRAVQVGRTVGNSWLVEGGLVAGDRVIVEGLQRIRPGMPVQVTEASPSRDSATPPAAGAGESPEPHDRARDAEPRSLPADESAEDP